MMMVDPAFRSAVDLAAEIRAKRIGCRELLDHYLGRVERFNPQINAIIVTQLDVAKRRADEADAALARGELWGPLHGVPMTVKESFDVAGLPTTWGLPEFKDSKAPTNALAVERMLGAGAVVFGKTNVPVLLADAQAYNPIYGSTNNPWDLSRSPGGSSGGAAAALAAGLTGLEIGSDIASSIRNPAHFSGVYGHKPTWGVCPPLGHALAGAVTPTDISAIGPLARSSRDLALAMSILAGPDEIESAGWRLELPQPRKKQLADYKIAVMLSDPVSEVDQSVQDEIQRLADFLAKAGATVDDRARPALDSAEVDKLYMLMLRAASSGRISPEALRQQREEVHALALDDESYRARMLRANTISHVEWHGLNERRNQMRWAWHEFFKDYDLLLAPPYNTPALPHDQEGERWQRMITVNGKTVPATTHMFWAGYTCAFYLPSTVPPIGLSPEGLPIGVQIVGPQYGDLICIEFARLLEEQYRAFVPPPGYA
jgi:amidase